MAGQLSSQLLWVRDGPYAARSSRGSCVSSGARSGLAADGSGIGLLASRPARQSARSGRARVDPPGRAASSWQAAGVAGRGRRGRDQRTWVVMPVVVVIASPPCSDVVD
jgi:hypothetical protein